MNMQHTTTPTHGNAISEIATLHNQIVSAARTSLSAAIRIGELLTGIKATLNHGGWGSWAQQNLPFTIRTATNYMRVFSKQDSLKSETVSDLTHAYQLLAEPDLRNCGICLNEMEKSKPDSHLIPKPGHSLLGHADDGQTNWIVMITPSNNEGFFFVNAFSNESRVIDGGGTLPPKAACERHQSARYEFRKIAFWF